MDERALGDPAACGTDSAVVRCVGLTKIFRDFWMRNRVRAVDGINLEVRRGEVFGLLGPNGSGKSTTVKLALGLLHATSGRVFVFDRRPEEVSIKRRIGYLPEESYLYRFLNARETLEYYGRLFFQSRRQRQKRIDMLLDMVGLAAVQRRPVGEYSKGMQRRIGLAQALINDPDLLILDEPTTGMDPIGTRQIKDLIFELAQRGKTVLLCSHLLADVEDVCHRVAIMFGGKIRKEGTVDDLLVQEGRTTIETATLDVATIQQIEQVLENHGAHIEKVEQPRQRLEDLFLDIVRKAMSEGAVTSGAQSGGGIAQFLIDSDDSQAAQDPNSAASLIAKLIARPPSGVGAEEVPAVAPVALQADEEQIGKLLTTHTTRTSPMGSKDEDGDPKAEVGPAAQAVPSGGSDGDPQKPDAMLIDKLLNESSPQDEDSASKSTPSDRGGND